jgi:uncharacterized iron-regulated membrane protein
MDRLNRIIFWCHLTTGVIAGIIILIMAVTGVLLAYERQIIDWADTRNYRAAPSSPGAARLPVEDLLARFKEAQPDAAPSTIILRADPTMPAAIAVAGGGNIFINPHTGEVLGGGSQGTRNFFRVITDVHRWLGARGEDRAVARAITGACNLGFLFMVVSGFYLWWPRKWRWPQVRNVIWFRGRLAGRARDFNWHNVIGFWSAVPLFIVVLSAVVISYTWASNLLYRIAGETPPAPRAAPAQAPAGRPAGEPDQHAAAKLAGLNQLWDAAEQQTTGWQSITMRLPASADAPVVFTIDRGNGGQPQARGQLTLNRATGEVVQWEPFSSYTTGRKLRSILRFAHTGEVAGIVGQTVAGLASAGGAVLVWTGLALSWRRLRAWRERARQQGRVSSAPQMAEGRQ